MLIKATVDGLTITGGNGERYFSTTIKNYDCVSSGSACIPASKFKELVSKMSGEISVELSGPELLTIKNKKSKFTISGQSHEFYPQLPERSGVSMLIMGKKFKSMISRTHYAARVKEDSTSPMLEGIVLTALSGRLEALACDRHRLARVREEMNTNIAASAVVKAKFLDSLSKLIDGGEEIELFFDDSWFFIATQDFTFYSKQIDGTYPATEKLIPVAFDSKLTVDSKKFLEALDRASVLLDGVNIVTLDISHDKTIVKTNVENGASVEEVDAKYTGSEPMQISFNAAFMIQALNSFGNVECNLNINGRMKPIIIDSEQSSGHIQLVLPYRTTV